MRPPDDVLADAAVAFGRALRRSGLRVGVDEELVFCRALGEVDLRRRSDVYWAARAAMLRRRDELEAFDGVFERFWAGVSLEGPGDPVAEHGEGDPRMPGPQHGGESLPQFRLEGRSAHVLDGGSLRASRPLEIQTPASEEGGKGERRGVLAAYSPEEILTERDRLAYVGDELAAVRRLGEALRLAAPERRSRRLRASRAGRFDLRASVRRALETDGEVLRPAFASHSRKPRRIVFLCDVSGSMERYSRAVLASLRGAVGAGIRAEAFVFATRLTRLTRDLTGHDSERALEAARRSVPDWSGGTRIGRALGDFRRVYGCLGLARGAIVVVVSDGWDRGDPDLLARELAHLRLQARRLVWLNPRPADLGGQPLAVGMRAALPHVDDFIAGHDPRAFARLALLIGGLGASRPLRRQGSVRR